MNASLFDHARAERFAQLVDEANGARRHHSHSRLDAELAELVATGQQLRAMPISVEAEPRFKRDLRAQLLATAVREGIGVTAKKPEAKRSRGVRSRGALIVGIAAGTLALSGVSVASGEALPGDPLYGMKRSTERAQLALAGSDLTRGQLHLDFARTRMNEAYKLRSDEEGFLAALREMDTETQLGIRLLIASAMTSNDTTALDSIDRFASGQRLLVTGLLDLNAGAGREKVTESLTLISQGEQRAKAARVGLACGAKVTRSDGLGPVLDPCSGNPALKAGAPVNPLVPAVAGGAEAQVEEANDDGLLAQLGKFLGRLFGG